MSNRSAKLLLDVAEEIEHHLKYNPHHKLGLGYSVPLPPILVESVLTWARGYREFVEKQKKASPLEPSKEQREQLLATVDLCNGVQDLRGLLDTEWLGGRKLISAVRLARQLEQLIPKVLNGREA